MIMFLMMIMIYSYIWQVCTATLVRSNKVAIIVKDLVGRINVFEEDLMTDDQISLWMNDDEFLCKY
jgi:hypothetical protein